MVIVSRLIPAISIVMPLYNKELEVGEAINSVFNQTVTDWELIVVDDGSTDGSFDAVSCVEDKRVRVVQQINSGVSAARNHGIALARAEIIAFLDADDLWHKEFLSTIMALVAKFPKAGWFATAYYIRQPGASTKARLGVSVDISDSFILENYFSVAVRSDPPVWTSATAVTKKAITAIGGFPEAVTSGEDLLTWARLAVRYPLAYDKRPMATFVISGIERKPNADDVVGQSLTRLAREFPSLKGLRAYIGLWYRMQAVMSLRFDERSGARKFAAKACYYGTCQWRNYYTLVLSILPKSLGNILDSGLRKIRRFT